MKFIQQIDLLSPKVTIYGKDGDSRLKTKLGGFLTILSYMTIFAAICYFMQKFFNYDKPFIVMNEQPMKNLTYYNLNNLPIGLRLSDEWGTPYPDAKKLYHAKFIWMVALEENNFIQEYHYVDMVPCEYDKHISDEYKDVFKNFHNLPTFYCVDYPKVYDMQNFYGGTIDYSFAGWLIYQCNTTDAEANGCYEQDHIDKTLNLAYLDYFTADYSISSYDLDPISPKMISGRTQTSNFAYMRVWLGMHQGEYTTDLGAVFEDKSSVPYHTIELYKEDFKFIDKKMVNDSSFYFIFISMHNHTSKTFYSRSYMKFQELLASLGGIIKGILIISEVLFHVFASKITNLFLIDEIPKYYKLGYLHGNNLPNSSTIQNLSQTNTKMAKTHTKDNDKSNVSNPSGSALYSEISRVGVIKNNFVAPESKDPIDEIKLELAARKLGRRLIIGKWEKMTPLTNCKSKEMIAYNKGIKIVHKTLSVHNLIKSLIELEELKSFIFNNEERHTFDFMFSCSSESPYFSEITELYRRNTQKKKEQRTIKDEEFLKKINQLVAITKLS